MPKSSKKRKDKAADFSKAKLKLGKGKKLAPNAIDTSFKARSIALPTQSITVDKDSNVPTTKRRLSLEDLISHMKHYNPGTRKDAIQGLRELFEANRELIMTSLTDVMAACVRLMADEDAIVRKTLLSFLAWLLPEIPPEDLIPHSPTLLLFVTSAQTHIYPEIRVDAVRFLDLLMERIPGSIVSEWNQANGSPGSRVLEGYLGVLNAGTRFGGNEGPMSATSTASVVLTSNSQLVVLQSLSNFLKYALIGEGTDPDSKELTWFLRPYFTTTEAYEAFEKQLRPKLTSPNSSRSWCAEEAPANDKFVQCFRFAEEPSQAGWSLDELSDSFGQVEAFAGTDSPLKSQSSFLVHLAKTLHPVLISAFLDHAPVVFAPNNAPPEMETKLVFSVAEISRTLYSEILKGQALSGVDYSGPELHSFLGYMAPYFPFRLGGHRDIRLERYFQGLNLIYSDLASLLFTSRPTSSTDDSSPNTGRVKLSRSIDPKLTAETARVGEYVVSLLEGSDKLITTALTPAIYDGLLPAIWALLNAEESGTAATRGVILEAVVRHATKTNSKAAVKGATLGFISRLVLLQSDAQYRGRFRLTDDGEIDVLREWIKHLPQTLWELGTKNKIASETILRFLLRLLRIRSELVSREITAWLGTRLSPFFFTTHPTKGPLPGPFVHLPKTLQRLALDVVIATLLFAEGEGLEVAVDQVSAKIEEQERTYWVNIRARFGV